MTNLDLINSITQISGVRHYKHNEIIIHCDSKPLEYNYDIVGDDGTVSTDRTVRTVSSKDFVRLLVRFELLNFLQLSLE